MSFRALYYPSSLLDRANDEAKAAWQKQCEALKKSGKDKADFPDPPAPPEGWQICISDRVSWTAYFFWVGMMEWVEHMAFEGETWGLLWWPRVSLTVAVTGEEIIVVGHSARRICHRGFLLVSRRLD